MESETTTNRGLNYGPIIIIFIFGLAFALAIFAWVFRYYQGRQALNYWGAENASIMKTADTLIYRRQLPGAPQNYDQLLLENATAESLTEKKFENFRDIGDISQLMLRDESFDFQTTRPLDELNWDYAFRFQSNTESFVILFASEEGMLHHAGAEYAIQAIPSFAQGLKKLAQSQWEEHDQQ